MPRLVFFDLETNGLHSNCEILQIGATAYSDNYPVFDEYIQPLGTISRGVTSVNGLCLNRRGQLSWKTQHGSQVISYARSAKEVLWDFWRWIGPGPCLLVAHNARRFDSKVLVRHFQEYHIPYNNISFADSLEMAREYLLDLDSHRQQDLEEYYDIENEDRHDALNDAETLKQIVFEILEYEFRSEKQCAAIIREMVQIFCYH